MRTSFRTTGMKSGDFASWKQLTINIKMVMILVQNIVFNCVEQAKSYVFKLFIISIKRSIFQILQIITSHFAIKIEYKNGTDIS